jgi:hypothetical protein
MRNIHSKYEVGDIVFVSKFKYKNNNSSGENHLFVIVDDNGEKLIPVEYFGMIVSSHREKCKDNSKFVYNEPLDKSFNNGLDYDSIVKCEQLFSILSENIQFKIGSVDIDDYMRFITTYSEAFKNIK